MRICKLTASIFNTLCCGHLPVFGMDTLTIEAYLGGEGRGGGCIQGASHWIALFRYGTVRFRTILFSYLNLAKTIYCTDTYFMLLCPRVVMSKRNLC